MNHSAFPCHKVQLQLSSSFWQIHAAEHKISNKKWDNIKFYKNNIREFPGVLKPYLNDKYCLTKTTTNGYLIGVMLNVK